MQRSIVARGGGEGGGGGGGECDKKKVERNGLLIVESTYAE